MSNDALRTALADILQLAKGMQVQRYGNLLINKLPKPMNDSADGSRSAANANHKLDDGEEVYGWHA